MATRTVINANATALPPTRGISIIIDQPQQLQQQQQRQRQQVATEQQQRGHSSKTSVSPTAAAAPATFPSSTTSSAYSSLGSDGNNYNRHNNNSSNYNNSHGYTTTLSTANKSSNFSTTFIDLNREDGADAEAEDDDGQKPRTGLSGRLSVRPSEAGQKTTTATKTSSTKITATATAATTTTIQETETTTTTTFPQLLLKVAGPEWVRHNNNNNNKNHNNNTSMSQSSSVTTTTTFAPLSERRKAKADVARSGGGDETAEAADTVGKAASDSAGERAASRSTNNSAGSSETKTETKSDTNTGAGAEAGIGISITHGRRESAADDEVVTTTTIIECNRDRQRGPHADHGDDDGDDDEVVESRRLGSRSRAGVGAGAGVGVAVGVGAGAARVDGGGRGACASHSQWPQLEATNTASSLEAADCASALTESVASAEENSHVVKIKISPSASASEDEDTTLLPSPVVDPRNNRARPTPRPQNKVSEKQVTVVQLNEPRPVVRELAPVATTKPKLANELAKELANVPELDRELGKSSGQSADRRMVQKPSSSGVGQNGGPTLGAVTSGNTTVTELNVSSPSSSYLYYMMSSGQFSPCDTLDSGTGSDLEGSGHGLCLAGSSPPKVPAKGAGVPKLELHLKSTKIRVNTNEVEKHDGDGDDGAEHQRANSLTDSEESESSLSCDSLNSSDYLRQSSSSPTAAAESQEPPPLPPLPPPSAAEGVPKSPLGSFLPDSLLRDIRDRKFPTNDFVAKYVDRAPPYDSDSANVNVNDDADADDNNNENDSRGNDGHGNANGIDYVQEAVEHAKYVRERNCSNANASARQRASLPSKTFVLNAADGSFVDTKLNSMPRRYEADKYYDFHVNEHENFRSFGNGNGSVNGDGCSEAGSWAEYEARGLQDDAFAGYRDIRCSSAASTIRSSKGTVRGVKNRVRNGIATFLQLQQPNGKNYKEKDLGKVVLYTTSMGIIRDTYAKCSNMKQILRTLLVKFEERDVFMSVEYQQEIKERMHSEAIKVPQLFVEGQHIGDADTVERLNESGELRQLLKPYKSIATTYTCQTCGGYRLLPCPSCNGSKKSVHRNHFTAEFVALKCMNCDEVGLVKCHNC